MNKSHHCPFCLRSMTAVAWEVHASQCSYYLRYQALKERDEERTR